MTEPYGLHYWTRSDKQIPDDELKKDLSGLAILESEGNSDLSSSTSALFTYKMKEGYFCAEIFSGDTETIYFFAKPFSLPSSDP